MIMSIRSGLTGEALIREINGVIDQINKELKNLDMENIATGDGYSFEQMKVPGGGKSGQVLKKASDKPYDIKWE